MNTPEVIYTIGHSTHPMEEFLKMLESQGIRQLVDVRKLPGSRKYPQFNQDNLMKELPGAGIDYLYFPGLGGRRKAHKDSKNNRWRNDSFKAYADYMETEDFKTAIVELEALALQKPTCYMCSEAVWWRCHRSMISDYLKVKGWKVMHIMSLKSVQEHPYTSPAKIVDGQLSYSDKD